MRVLIVAFGLALATPALADSPKAEQGRWLAEGASVSAGSSATAQAQEARVTPRPYVEPVRRAPAASVPAPVQRGGAWPGSEPGPEPARAGGLWPAMK